MNQDAQDLKPVQLLSKKYCLGRSLSLPIFRIQKLFCTCFCVRQTFLTLVPGQLFLGGRVCPQELRHFVPPPAIDCSGPHARKTSTYTNNNHEKIYYNRWQRGRSQKHSKTCLKAGSTNIYKDPFWPPGCMFRLIWSDLFGGRDLGFDSQKLYWCPVSSLFSLWCEWMADVFPFPWMLVRAISSQKRTFWPSHIYCSKGRAQLSSVQKCLLLRS